MRFENARILLQHALDFFQRGIHPALAGVSARIFDEVEQLYLFFRIGERLGRIDAHFRRPGDVAKRGQPGLRLRVDCFRTFVVDVARAIPARDLSEFAR